MKDSTMKTLTPFESALKDVEKTRSEENGKRAPGGERASTVDPLFQNLKIRIHRKLIDTIDLTKLSTLETEMIKVEIRRILEEMVMTESLPMVDARLPDGSRVNAITPPLALDGPILSIRRFGTDPLRMKDLIQLNAVPEQVAEVLAACVKARLNIVISGGTGAGKTTML